MKVKLVDEMMESVYLCIILHVKNKKWSFIEVLTWFIILGKIKNGSQNGDHCWCRHRPPAAPPPIKCTLSCWEEQRLSTEGKIVWKYCNISKTAGRGSITPPPPPATPLVPQWGYELRVRPRVKTAFIIYGWGPWGCFSLGNEGCSPRDQISHLHWPVPGKMNFLWHSADTKSSFLDLLVLHRSFVLFIFYRHHPYPYV